MSKGESDKLFIPWQLAYGSEGLPGLIGPF